MDKDNPIIIKVYPTPEMVKLIEQLLTSPGVKLGKDLKDPDEYLTIKQAAEEAQVNYHTLREWVVVKKIIPFSRLGGSPKGDIRILRRDLQALLAGKGQKVPKHRGREVTVI